MLLTFQLWLQVTEEDGLPSVVCPSCFAQLELSHQFKLQVEKADKILREEICVNGVLTTVSTSSLKYIFNISR